MADRNITGLYYFLGGLGAGVAAGILFAPDTGAVTRQSIGRKLVEGKDLVNAKAVEGGEFLKRQGAKLAQETNDFVERGKRVMNQQKDKVTSAVEVGKTAYHAAVNEQSIHQSGD